VEKAHSNHPVHFITQRLSLENIAHKAIILEHNHANTILHWNKAAHVEYTQITLYFEQTSYI